MADSKKPGRKTTISARIVRLCTTIGVLTIILMTACYLIYFYRRMLETTRAEVNTLAYAFASAVSNADIYSNNILANLFVEFSEGNEYGAQGYIITRQGVLVSATSDDDFLHQGDDIDKLAATEPGVQEFADLINELNTQFEDLDVVLNGFTQRTGNRVITINGKKYVVGWSSIKRYDTLNVYVLISYDMVMGPLIRMIVFGAFFCIVFSIISIIMSSYVAKKITEPLQKASKRMGELSRGDLYSPSPRTNRNDETMHLLKSLSLVRKSMIGYIDDLKLVLNSIADGNLNIAPQADYKGDFLEIKTALEQILGSLNNTFEEVHKAALSVNECSVHVSDGTAALSKNTSDEAFAISEITESVSHVNKRISHNAQQAANAYDMSNSANKHAIEGRRNMELMVEAINEIKATSSQIEHIITVIDDIAFQTNILALNAAVEAARAGDAGKGFAVVADEVRTLAVKSSEAASQTKTLIENSLEAISNGARLASDTQNSLLNVAEIVSSTRKITKEISDSAKDQAEEITKISSNMEHINSTIIENSRTAEQNAAVSQELSGQFELLSSMIDRFKLK